ncbi:sugar MFS transporter [Arundinibacter roseus]|uniref:Glucose/galactose MFS transporter n=1 Tax=Arundinibacter roseus TaxID=2070510 RepID=A0A4V2XAB3_9BACT|nr:sugar MFS transporter [Arundinibacter roseus]TDB66995.1 glucose/galactose MFS transporter [Arundinibacter roseus]
MTQKKENYLGPLVIIGVLFFILGFVTWVNGTLITFFKKAFNLDNATSYLVTFAFFISYTLMAIPSSVVLKKVGFKNGMSVGLLVMAVGTIIFIPAAKMASYSLFLVGLFGIGIGLTILQTAINPYVTILGPRESAAARISFMGIANKGAGIISQVVFGGLLLAGTTNTTQAEELDKVVGPYLTLTAILVGLALLIRMTKGLPEVEEEEEEIITTGDTLSVSKTSIFQFPNLILGVISLFCYVGVEVIAGDTIISYGVSLGFPEEDARLFGTYTLVAMMVGYVMGIVLIPKFVSQQVWLKYSALFGILITLIAIFTTGFTSVLCIALLGLSHAIMWGAIWPLAIDGLGKFIKTGAALLIMGISGGAILPLVYGWLADSIGSTQQAYVMMVPLYLFVYYYSVAGYKKRSW